MPLAIRRSPLPVRGRDASAQEEADRHYSLGCRDGLLRALKWVLGLDYDYEPGALVSVEEIWAGRRHVEATGRLPGEEAKGAGLLDGRRHGEGP